MTVAMSSLDVSNSDKFSVELTADVLFLLVRLY